MGIKGLMKLISDHAPSAVKEKEMENYFGLKVAVDASMSLYQFLIAVRSGPEGQMLTNEAGDVTSHLQGMLYRTARMLENGVKPVFVFDGKPPQLKKHELDKRTERREENEQKLADFKDSEDQENINRYEKRLVKVTKEHNAECRRLLSLMGVPIVEAPGEAEAQCAALCKAGKVYATATEDMDALTFGTSKLVRHMTFSKERKLPIVEVDLATVLRDMELSMEQFIDLCILCGCDYTSSIRGIGPTTAYKLIKDHKSLEKALTKLGDKHKVPEDFMYKEAHQLFVTPDVMNPDDCRLVWSDPDEEGIIAFLVGEKGFALERVKGAIKRLKEARGKGTQKRMESFFGVTVAPSSSQPKKRKEPEKKGVKGAAKMAGVAKFSDSKKGKAKGSTKKEPAKKKHKTESDD